MHESEVKEQEKEDEKNEQNMTIMIAAERSMNHDITTLQFA